MNKNSGLPPSGTQPFDSTLAAKIDHTLLKADVKNEELKLHCEEARAYSFASVCVNSVWIERVTKLLNGSPVKPIAVVGFPLGAMLTAAKAFEAREAVRMGAQEIDMVIALSAVKNGDWARVEEDIRAVVDAAQPALVKVILETSLLNEQEKIKACEVARDSGAAFVKTSTGFGSRGATIEDVALMRRVVGSEVGVKASGGIRTRGDARKMLAAGANRIGASASVAIVTEGFGDADETGEKNEPAPDGAY